ncbi:MAG: hypothetical protein Ct9H300mP12_08450 [Acidimicrobiales bacterium]|nr:MAG: hypothetical protein Ct9H300mP12_08450 [Acidimicrobiales bacterium]
MLFVLRIWGSQESRQLAGEAGISGGTLTGVLDTLERKGWPSGEQFRKIGAGRSQPHSAGNEVVEEVMPAFNREEALVTGDLTDDEMAMLARLLRKVLQTTEDLDSR